MKSIVLALGIAFSPALAAMAGPLHDAVKAGDLETVETMIADNVDIQEVDYFLGSPLHVAAASGHVAIARLLIEAGADVDSREYGRNETPLHQAAGFGRTEIVRLLLAYGANLNPAEDRQKTPLHKALSDGHEPAAIALIEAGADLTARTVDGDSALALAGETHLYDAIALLLERGAGPPEPVDIKPLIPGADVERGRELVQEGYCLRCHHQESKEASFESPPLWNSVGRKIGAGTDYPYSQAFRTVGGTWDYDNLNRLLANPIGFFPGTRMNLTGLAGTLNIDSPRDRADIIAFLRTQADEPLPLP